ncbi:MAG: 5'-nucleotidase C-terminal domain-containing protein [Elusimicrobiota bacterium]|jgi:2',3'-cyclic-nucleotide 2'-phosphodiesterase (5'-nucleotidase family)|nr:5'-nucleotidase C-terminal domain-containing protein [Elusimicrobiota bacterium]
MPLRQLKKFILFFVLLLPTGLPAKQIAIYHTSDIHGYYFARENAQGGRYGGFAALESLLKKETLPFILLDSGDFSSGNKEANDSDGKYSIDLMNAAGNTPKNFRKRGYAALTIGNHDSDFGDEKLSKMLKFFDGDVLSINIEGLKVKPYKIYKVGGINVAVIGFSLDGPGMTGMRVVKTDENKLKTVMKNVLKHKPQVVILLAHDSIGDSRKPSNVLDTIAAVPLAKNNIDLFLGGHAHIENISRILGPEGPLFVEDGSMLEGVGRIIIDVDDITGKTNGIQAQYIKLDVSKVGEDAGTKAFLDEIEDKTLTEVFGNVPERITKYPSGKDGSAEMSKLMADEFYRYLSEKEKLDLAAFSIPSVRRDIEVGDLTGRDISELFPYKEYPASFDINGGHLKKVIKESIKRDKRYGDYSLFSYSKNVKILYKFNEGKDDTVELLSATINGVEIDDKKIYRMAALSHIPEGFFEGAPFVGLKNKNKKIYEDITPAALLFNIVKASNYRLVVPNDLRIVIEE